MYDFHETSKTNNLLHLHPVWDRCDEDCCIQLVARGGDTRAGRLLPVARAFSVKKYQPEKGKEP